MKHALITGVGGQDGSYLAELLLANGYSVSGVDRRNVGSVDGVEIIVGNILKRDFVLDLVYRKFDEIYNLASVSTVQSPWEDPVGTVESTALAPLYFLEAIRTLSPSTRFFQASSTEMHGDVAESPQNETTAFRPRSPYGFGKLFAHNMIEKYRSMHGIFAVSGILFNHESPRRSTHFVTRKITSTLVRIANGENEVLVLGNLDAKRDWGFAGDYVEAMWMMLQTDIPDDYIIASGESHTVRDFVEATASALNLKVIWEGSGDNEVGKDAKGNALVRVSKEFFRPIEKVDRCGDISKIKKTLGWKPKTSFAELVRMMVEAEK